MLRRRLLFLISILMAAEVAACGRMEQSARARPGDGAVIFQATILTMDSRRPAAEAMIVKDGAVLDLGSIDDLVQAYPGASFDERLLRRTVLPAFVDVRVSPNALKVLEVPCQGGLLAEDIVAAGADGAPVRVVASGRVALDAAIEAALRIPEEAAIGRVSVEARGQIDARGAQRLTATKVPLILSAEAVPESCDPGADPRAGQSDAAAPAIAGVIALSPSTNAGFLAAAAARLRIDGDVRLSPQEALEAITSDAAFALGAEMERGVIAVGRRADFAVLDRNPLATPAEAWASIDVQSFSAATAP